MAKMCGPLLSMPLKELSFNSCQKTVQLFFIHISLVPQCGFVYLKRMQLWQFFKVLYLLGSLDCLFAFTL